MKWSLAKFKEVEMKFFYLSLSLLLCSLSLQSESDYLAKIPTANPVFYTFTNSNSKDFTITFSYKQANSAPTSVYIPAMGSANVEMSGQCAQTVTDSGRCIGRGYFMQQLSDFRLHNGKTILPTINAGNARQLLATGTDQTLMDFYRKHDESEFFKKYYAGYYTGPFPAANTTFIIKDDPNNPGKYIFEKK